MAKRKKNTNRTHKKRLAVKNVKAVSVVHDKSTGKCSIYNAKGEVIVEEDKVEKVTLNFAEGRVTFVTDSSMLAAYDLNTGNQIISARYNGGTLEVRKKE